MLTEKMKKVALGILEDPNDQSLKSQYLLLQREQEKEASDNPEVGNGATYSVGNDSYPYTVVALQRNGRTVVLQSDFAFRVDSQDYVCFPNDKGDILHATLRKDGEYRLRGAKYGHVHFGVRKKYLDPGEPVKP